MRVRVLSQSWGETLDEKSTGDGGLHGEGATKKPAGSLGHTSGRGVGNLGWRGLQRAREI